MATGVRSRYHVAINGNGFMLRGAPMRPVYVKQEAVSLLESFRVQHEAGIVDYGNNSFTGASWNFWTQTDWSGGFQNLEFKDDGSFRDGQAVEVINKYGQVTLQNAYTSAVTISGSHTYGAHDINNNDLILGTVKSGAAKVFKITSASVMTTLSAYTGISAVNTMTRYNNNTIIGMTRTSGTLKTLAKYNGTAISGFRSANPTVRSARGVGIRLYTGERVASLSGDVLYYTTDLSTYTSAYQAGKNRKIAKIFDLNGNPYFFIQEGNKVEFYRFDEIAQFAYLIYTWSNLTNFGVTSYTAYMIITGTSNGKSVGYTFNGARLNSIFDDQLGDTSYDFSKPFEYRNQLHTKNAFWDGSVWSPGLYGKYGPTQYTPFVNYGNRAYGFAVSGSKMNIAYVDSTKYSISGNVVGSRFGSIIGGVDKLVNLVDVNFDVLKTGETIEMFQSVDNAASFTSIGKASYATDGAVKKKTMYFPSGLVTKLWHYKAVLAGPGTTTPTLFDINFQYRPAPDLKKRWNLSLDAGDNVMLLNKQSEARDGKAIVSDLWLEKENKRTVLYEDLDGFNVTIISAMAAADTSARVSDTRLLPPRGRMRVLKSNAIEEMIYTSANGGVIKGITRARKNTLARIYSAGDIIDNFYTVYVTNIQEQSNSTDQKSTESIATVTLLEV